MGGPTIYFGAEAGPQTLRRQVELDPYDVNYVGFDLHPGIESPDIALPFLSKWVARMNVIGELSYSYIGGDERNRGSHRHLLLARGGVRARFFDLLFLDVDAGIGWAHNHLDFGKGFPLPTEETANMQLRTAVGAQICLSRDLCFAPYVGLGYEFSISDPFYEIQSLQFGIRVGGNPSSEEVPDTEETVPEPLDDCPPSTPCGRERDRIIASAEPPPPPIMTEGARVLSLPEAIHFGNDNPDLPLQPQWFKGSPQLFECFSHPELDHFIRTFRHWVEKLDDLKRAGIPDTYAFTIRVKGYANDTGTVSRNQRLALNRSQGVIDYMTVMGKKSVSRMKSTLPHLYSLRKSQLQRAAGMNLDKITHRQICGAQDSTGKGRYTLVDLLAPRGPLTIVNENVINPRDPKQDIIKDFGLTISPENPVFRRARIAIDVIKNGAPLPPEATRAFLAELGIE